MIKVAGSIALVLFLFSLFYSIPVSATWSIIGVDRTTREIGIAGASCTFDVSGIASIVPNKGAIVVQAASNYFARMEGVKSMQEGNTPATILKAMMKDDFNPERQQYGLILVQENSQPLVYAGEDIKAWNGSYVGSDFEVLGNILVGRKVVDSAQSAFEQGRDDGFAQRMMKALEAGEKSGGDKRCASQAARSAFISTYRPQSGAIVQLSVYGIEPGGKPAVTLLNNKFAQLYNVEQADDN